MIENLTDMTSLEILGLAVRKEIEAADFYEKLVERIQNPLVKARIGSLAREEKNHEKMLRTLYSHQSGEEHPPIPPSRPEVKKSIENIGDLDAKEAVKLAIEREREAEEMYTIAAQKNSDGSANFILLYLSEMEKGHRLALEVELDRLDKDTEWFEKDLGADIQLVGP